MQCALKNTELDNDFTYLNIHTYMHTYICYIINIKKLFTHMQHTYTNGKLNNVFLRKMF